METRINEVGTTSADRKRSLTAGIILVAVGLLFLVTQLLDFGVLLFVIPGVVLLAAGAVRRSAGLIIPGGILGGLAAAALIAEGFVVFPGTDEGAQFLLALAGGFALIPLFTALFTERVMVWPLIPVGIMAAIAGALLLGTPALTVLEALGRWWPAILIIAGVSVLAGSLVKRAQ